MRSRAGVDRRVGEDALDRGLRVVEVAADSDGVDVRLGRRGHLEALDARSSGRGVEHDDLGSVDSREALHSGRAGVAARRGEHQHAPSARGVAHEDREHRQGDVLERAGAAVEELEDVEGVLFNEGNRILRREAREEAVYRGPAHLLGEVAEERVQDELLGGTEGQTRVI